MTASADIVVVPAGIIAIDSSASVAIAAGLISAAVIYLAAYLNIVGAIDLRERPVDLRTVVAVLFPLLITFVTFLTVKTINVMT